MVQDIMVVTSRNSNNICKENKKKITKAVTQQNCLGRKLYITMYNTGMITLLFGWRKKRLFSPRG